MTSSRFDQEPDKPYGTCTTCGIELATEELSREHIARTLDEALKEGRNRSHGVVVGNQTREGRIESAIASLVDDAIAGVLDDVEGLIQAGHITRDEATAALAPWSDFADGWSDSDHDKEEGDR